MPEILSFTQTGTNIFTEKRVMIYLKNDINPQTVRIPKNGFTGSGELVLTIRNTVSLTEYGIDISAWTSGQLYVTATVVLPEEIPSGSYEYTLSCKGITVSSGCLQLTDDSLGVTEYVKDVEYRQYGGE